MCRVCPASARRRRRKLLDEYGDLETLLSTGRRDQTAEAAREPGSSFAEQARIPELVTSPPYVPLDVAAQRPRGRRVDGEAVPAFLRKRWNSTSASPTASPREPAPRRLPGGAPAARPPHLPPVASRGNGFDSDPSRLASLAPQDRAVSAGARQRARSASRRTCVAARATRSGGGGGGKIESVNAASERSTGSLDRRPLHGLLSRSKWRRSAPGPMLAEIAASRSRSTPGPLATCRSAHRTGDGDIFGGGLRDRPDSARRRALRAEALLENASVLKIGQNIKDDLAGASAPRHRDGADRRHDV